MKRQSLLRDIAAYCRRPLVQDESGSVAVTVALTGFVLVVLAGAAIDMGIFIERRSQVAAAVDSSLTAAVSIAYQAEASGKNLSEAAAAGVKSGKDLYAANTGQLDADVTGKDLTLTVEKKIVNNVPSWVASAKVDGLFTTYFLKMIAVRKLALRVNAASAVAIQKTMDYWVFTLAVDVSQSMGIASTVADMNRMIAYDGCYFACHEGPNDRMSKLKAMGIDFRIDAVTRAVSTMASTIKQSMQGNAQVSLFTFNNSTYWKIRPTYNIDTLINYQIDLPVWTPSYWARVWNTSDGNSSLRTLLIILNAFVNAGGDGKSAASPKQAVFLITDGVHDVYGSKDDFTKYTSMDNLHMTGPVNPAYCKSIKDKGITLAVLYVTYYIPPGVSIPEVQPFYNDILTNLKACASSPDLFFNATEGAGITAALQKMLAVVQGSGNVRLTN
jgi:hypothetical protein